jgi:non-heme chloroperoxidase
MSGVTMMNFGYGIFTRQSARSFEDTLSALERTLAARRVRVFARIDHSGEAARVGLAMLPTQLFIIGNPLTGTPIMVSAPSAALDLPIRLLVAADATGHTSVSYDTVEYLEARHGFSRDLGRNLAVADGIIAEALGLPLEHANHHKEHHMTIASTREQTHHSITVGDGTELYYKDWGSGQPVIFSHGWPLNADAWEDQMFFLASRGYRCIAHDRRGHGRSSQPWAGNDMDTYADDLAALVEALDVDDAVHVGHSTGGGEVARYIGRHGTKRVAKAVLISAIPPLMLKTPTNPAGSPVEVFDHLRASVQADRSQFWKDLSAPFYGANRPGAKVSQGLRDSFWAQGMQAGYKAAYDCIKVFSETDQTEDLKSFDVPTLILHGDDDQIVPIAAAAMQSSKLVKGAVLKVYNGAPHGMPSTHKDQVNADLLAFIRG